ncbi:MAG: hypothetical protein ACLP19_04690 [Xanthobacteraceae bacterium]
MGTIPTPEFPAAGVLWRGWDDETLRIIDEKHQPVLLFVRDTDPLVWPFLRETFHAMPKNAKLCALVHERCTALYTEVETLPEELKLLGAGTRYHIAILSPYGLTPIVTIDPTGGGRPAEIVERIVALLERMLEAWR